MSSWILIFKKWCFISSIQDTFPQTRGNQLNVLQELRWLRTHRSVSLHFEETHDQKPPPRERRLQLRNSWQKKRTVIAGAWWKRCQVVYSLMRVIAVVECCEGLLWIKERPRFQSGVQGRVLQEAEFFPVFFNLRWMILDIINKGLHFDS